MRGIASAEGVARKVLILLAALFALVALTAAGCGGDDDDDEAADTAAATGEEGGTGAAEGSIWVLLPDSASSDRWEKDDRRFFEESFDAAGVEYNIVNAEGDANTQLSQAEQAINAGAKVILLVNLSSESGATIIDTARDAGVKVVDYDRLTAAGSGVDGPGRDSGRCQRHVRRLRGSGDERCISNRCAHGDGRDDQPLNSSPQAHPVLLARCRRADPR